MESNPQILIVVHKNEMRGQQSMKNLNPKKPAMSGPRSVVISRLEGQPLGCAFWGFGPVYVQQVKLGGPAYVS